MKRILWLFAALTFASPTFAADNVAVTPGTGKTMACLDITAVCYSKIIIYNTAGAALGVTANPFVVTFPSAQPVTASAGTNLNTSLLALESGGNLASIVTQLGAVTASPTANTLADRLKTINTTLGTPFQAGGSIGNTTIAVTNAGTFAVQAPITSWAGGTLGSMANYGTSPGAVLVPGVNAYVTNSPAITGNVGGYDFQLAPTITVQNASYAAGNSLGGLITVTGAARTNGGAGILNGIRLKSSGGATNTIWVYAWSKTPTATCTDKSAYVTSASDSPYALVGFPAQVVMGNAPGAWDTTTTAQLTALLANFKNQDSSPGTALYICLVTAGTVTPATTADLSINLGGSQD
jgi:hypothetical protein